MMSTALFSLKVWFETSNRQNRQMEMRSHPCTALLFIFEWFVHLLTHVMPFILSLNGLYLFSPGLISHPCTAHLEKPSTTHLEKPGMF